MYVGTWEIMTKRDQCMTYFGSMTPEDDKKETNGVNVHGRWSNMGNATGVVVFEANNYRMLHHGCIIGYQWLLLKLNQFR